MSPAVSPTSRLTILARFSFLFRSVKDPLEVNHVASAVGHREAAMIGDSHIFRLPFRVLEFLSESDGERSFPLHKGANLFPVGKNGAVLVEIEANRALVQVGRPASPFPCLVDPRRVFVFVVVQLTEGQRPLGVGER